MQHLQSSILDKIKSIKMKELEGQFRNFIEANRNSTMVICPICNYQNKNGRGTAKVFEDSFKCFSCGVWRRI